MISTMQVTVFRSLYFAMAFVAACLLAPAKADAQVTAFKQAVAEAAAKDRDLANFYQANGYRGIWTGNSGKDRRRRQELFKAIASADRHGCRWPAMMPRVSRRG